MGCDGGTIPKRDELVRTKKKPEQKDKQSELSFKWGHCSITQEPLQTPIVACQLGRLYSKVAIIESLLDRTILPEGNKYIKSIKDVKELNLTENPAYKDSLTKGDVYNDNIAPYICPVIGLEMNGKYKFVYFWSCGCVISERALKAVKSQVCHKCQQPFKEEDVIILNGTDEEVDSLRVKMEARQARIKAEKKIKKSVKAESTVTKESDEKSNNNAPSTSKNDSKPSTSKLAIKRTSNIKQIEDPMFKKTKLNYSVAKDPKASEVFKSLFTSHKSAENKTKAHWITYNPFYN